MVLMSKIRTAIKVLYTFGIIELFRICIKKFVKTEPLSEAAKFPKEVSFYRKSELSNSILSNVLCLDEVLIGQLRVEHSRYNQRIRERLLAPRSSFFSTQYDLGLGMSEVLFLAVRGKKPSKIIETGVAAGVSTNLILFALNENQNGKCVSIDITPKVGEIIEDELKNRWQLEVLPEFSREDNFNKILIANLDATFFLHDSDHAKSWQIKEFSAVIQHLAQVQLILFDDISEALIEFIREYHPKYQVLMIDEGQKYSGIIYKAELAVDNS